MPTLIERLERATEGSRDLDAEIDAAIHGRTILMVEEDQFPETPGRYWYDKARFADPPHYTTSVDVAMTLMPEGAVWTLLTDYGGLCRARIFNAEPELFVQEDGATPALALVSACLKAREMMKGQEG